jgi:hypothetical protein
MGNDTRLHRRTAAILMLLIAVLFSFSSYSFAQGYGRVVSQPEDLSEKPIRPYLFVNFGYGDPVDDAYDLAFDNPLLRYGGGFGMIFYDFGAEVVLRRGSQEETHVVAAAFGDEFPRSFFMSSTEIQFRVYGRPHIGKTIFPTGVGVGLTTMTVDRGYPGVFDRFAGSGLYVGPFIGVEYPVNDYVSFGAEVEYGMSESTFSGSDAWSNQHDELIDEQRGYFPATEDGFWDTVGGTGEDFSNGGLIVSVRATLFIPTYQGN